MKRRSFLKKGLVFTGLIWVPKPNIIAAGFPNPGVLARLKGASGAAACDTLRDNNGSAQDATLDFAFYTWITNSFVAAATTTICRAEADLIQFGTAAAGTLQAKIYTDSAGSPGTLIGSASDTVDRTTIDNMAFEFVSFQNMSASLTASTTYWFILQASSVDTNGSNCILWKIDNTSETATRKGSTNGTAWDGLQVNSTFVFKTYSV